MLKYEEVAGIIRGWVHTGVLKPGQRVPSIRQMSVNSGYSQMTVSRAYEALENESVIVATPRSGHFVSAGPTHRRSWKAPHDLYDLDADQSGGKIPLAKRPTKGLEISTGDLALSADLTPVDTLNKLFRRQLLATSIPSAAEATVSGIAAMKEFVVKRYSMVGAALQFSDIVIAPSSRCALDICIGSDIAPGDIVLIESPSYFPMIGALEDRGVRFIEIYSHPVNGIDPEQFDHILRTQNVRLCILSPTNHFPTGVTYPASVMERIVELAASRNVRIIEFDLFGEHANDREFRNPLRSFDKFGNVTYVGGLDYVLGGRYGLGWIVKKNAAVDLSAKLRRIHPTGLDVELQQAVAAFVGTHSYERYLRRLRHSLNERIRYSMQRIYEIMPNEFSVTWPSGGYVCWIRGPSAFDSMKAAELIGFPPQFLPGPMLSIVGSFKNFFALNLSFPWSAELEVMLTKLAHVPRRQAVAKAS